MLGIETKLSTTGTISAKQREQPDNTEIMEQTRRISKEGLYGYEATKAILTYLSL